MTSNLHDLIRDAAQRQAELAVAPDRIRAALAAHDDRGGRRRRLQTWLVVAAAATVAVAVAVPTIAMRGLDGEDRPAASESPAATESASSGPATSPAPSVSPNLATLPLRYRPTWLPPGMVEQSRHTPLATMPDPNTAQRIWSATPLDHDAGLDRSADPVLALQIWRHGEFEPGLARGDRPQTGPRQVDINGKQGYLWGTEMLRWEVDAETELILTAPKLDLPEADLVRIARSVQPDLTQQRAPLHVGWLPEGFVAHSVGMAGSSPTRWEGNLVASQFDEQRYPQRTIMVYVGTIGRTTGPGQGEQLTIGGRPARLWSAPPGATDWLVPVDWVLAVDLGQGRQLTVYGDADPTPAEVRQLTRDEIIRVAESVELDPNPDLGWIGH